MKSKIVGLDEFKKALISADYKVCSQLSVTAQVGRDYLGMLRDGCSLAVDGLLTLNGDDLIKVQFDQMPLTVISDHGRYSVDLEITLRRRKERTIAADMTRALADLENLIDNLDPASITDEQISELDDAVNHLKVIESEMWDEAIPTK